MTARRPTYAAACRDLTQALDAAFDALCALDADLGEEGQPPQSLRRTFISEASAAISQALNRSPFQMPRRLVVVRPKGPPIA